MDAFNFVFSLFGLLLGLSLAEVIGGMVRTLKLRNAVRIGWLTPLLGTFVMLDVTSFWSVAWDSRAGLPVTYGALVVGLVVTSLYYAAASLVFPDDPAEWPDFNAYYLKHRVQVLGAIWLCNVAAYAVAVMASDEWSQPVTIAMQGIYTLLIATAAFSSNKKASGGALSILILLYLIDTVI